MQFSDLFFNSVGRLRSGWRLLIFVLILILISVLSDAILRALFSLLPAQAAEVGWMRTLMELFFRGILLISALVAGWGTGRLLEDLPWRALGWALHRGFDRDFLIGCAIGAGSLMIAAAIAAGFGKLRFSFAGQGAGLAIGKTLVVSALIFLIAAAAEETLFRGYALQTLTRAGLMWLGVFLTSVPFALIHLRNPNVVAGFTFINTSLAGVWLAVAYLRTRSLWFPLGVHFAWNWTMAAFLGIPVSGIVDLTPNPVFRSTDFGPAWLTGGAYGLEGGAACTVALVISTVFIWRTKLISATSELQELTSHEIPKLVAANDPPSAQDVQPS